MSEFSPHSFEQQEYDLSEAQKSIEFAFAIYGETTPEEQKGAAEDVLKAATGPQYPGQLTELMWLQRGIGSRVALLDHAYADHSVLKVNLKLLYENAAQVPTGMDMLIYARYDPHVYDHRRFMGLSYARYSIRQGEEVLEVERQPADGFEEFCHSEILRRMHEAGFADTVESDEAEAIENHLLRQGVDSDTDVRVAILRAESIGYRMKSDEIREYFANKKLEDGMDLQDVRAVGAAEARALITFLQQL